MAKMQHFKPPSLAQCFEAPEDYVGQFGWLVGYSANAGFLNEAVERFTRQTQRQRGCSGQTALAIMLDPGNPQIPPADVSGALHLPALSGDRSYKLLHAKLALLGFRHIEMPNKWRLHLIVSTGNWTRQTLEESLDLVWRIEIGSEELDGRVSDEIKQHCADFKAAWELIDWLRKYFDCRALMNNSQHLEEWIKLATSGRGLPSPRLFDNREKSFMDQLPRMVKATGSSVARNYLGMGSGYYESARDKHSIPSVLKNIVDGLKKESLLTGQPEVAVFVNPQACQAVATAAEVIENAGWSVRIAEKPDYFGNAGRFLHAKFIFSANWRENSNNCSSAWVYLGSGNLTGPGFTQKMSANGGNLEFGVVFVPNGLLWEEENGAEPWKVVTNLLPIQWDENDSLIISHDALQAGSDMPEREDAYVAAPVAWLDWCANESGEPGGCLSVPDNETSLPFDVLNSNGDICEREGTHTYQWPDDQPRQVRLRWKSAGQQHTVIVPVCDEFGRIAAVKLPALGMEEVWLQLASFPIPPEDEDSLTDGGNTAVPGTTRGGDYDASGKKADYSIRLMMQLIENIAARQTEIDPPDWTAWCTRLEQSLVQASGCDVLNEIHRLQINPLGPLWYEPFRPDFAETAGSKEGKQYEDMLRRVEERWNVKHLKRLGELM